MVKIRARIKNSILFLSCVAILYFAIFNYGYSATICYCIIHKPETAILLLKSGWGNLNCPTFPSFMGDMLNRWDIPLHTPLELACREGRMEIINECLKRGSDPNYAPSTCNLPIESTILKNTGQEHSIINLLIKNGADVNARSKYANITVIFKLANELSYEQTPMQNMIQKSICLLIDNGAQTLDNEGWSLLHYVIRSDCSNYLLHLIQKHNIGYDTSPTNETLLEFAIRCKSHQCVNVLNGVFEDNSLGSGNDSQPDSAKA